MLQTLDLFAGIGGFALGLERTGGFETVAFCEIEPYPRAVLAKHWPGVKQYDDVRALTGAQLEADRIAVDVITGGFPCQDISAAGKQAGIDETTRSGLWSEIARLVGEIQPRYVIVENVSALLSGPSERRGGWFGRVLGDLAEIGYDAEWHCIQAADVGAPHLRDRIWIVAHPQHPDPDSERLHRETVYKFGEAEPLDKQISVAGSLGPLLAHPNDTQRRRREKREQGWDRQSALDGAKGNVVYAKVLQRDGCWPPEPNVGRVADGVPRRVDRLKALGNAVVPKIPEMIGHAILERERTHADS